MSSKPSPSFWGQIFSLHPLRQFRHFRENPWTIWIGCRYLRSKKNSKFLSFITTMSMMGIGLGVMSMIIVLSVMDGFEMELKKRMVSSDLHILVQPTRETPGFNKGFVPSDLLSEEKLKEMTSSSQGQIQNFWPMLTTEAILKSGRKVMGVVVKGVTQSRLDVLNRQVQEVSEPQFFSEKVGQTSVQLPGVFIGKELAYEMGIIPGDRVTFISPKETEGPLETVPRMSRFVVEGIYHSGLPEQELHTVYARIQNVEGFLRESNIVSQWEVTVKDFDRANEVATQIRSQTTSFLVKDWMQLNAPLFASLKLERISMFIILAFIVLVASFNIITTLTLMVLEKKKEISILKAMGADNSHVRAIFLAEGILIGGVGVIGGTLLGFLVCLILKRYEFITLPEIYYDRTLPVTFSPLYYIGISLSAFFIVLIACVYPSQKAAKLDPLEGIRFGA